MLSHPGTQEASAATIEGGLATAQARSKPQHYPHGAGFAEYKSRVRKVSTQNSEGLGGRACVPVSSSGCECEVKSSVETTGCWESQEPGLSEESCKE